VRRPVATLTILTALAALVAAVLLAPGASGRSAAFKTIRGKGVSIAAPTTWRKGPSPGVIRLTASAPRASVRAYPTNVSVLAVPRTAKTDPAKVRASLAAIYRRLGITATVLRSRSLRLPAGQALEFVYRGRVRSPALNLRWITYVIDRPARVYVVSLGATAARYPGALATFRTMARSFRVTA
jgi:hypothetical protein